MEEEIAKHADNNDEEDDEIMEDPPSNIRVVIKSMPTVKRSASLLEAQHDEDGEAEEDARELYTHFYVPDQKPAPYAQSHVDDSDLVGHLTDIVDGGYYAQDIAAPPPPV